MSILMPVEKFDLRAAMDFCGKITNSFNINAKFFPVGGVCSVTWCVTGRTKTDRLAAFSAASLDGAVKGFFGQVLLVDPLALSDPNGINEASKEVREALSGDAGDAHDYAMAARAAGIDWKYEG